VNKRDSQTILRLPPIQFYIKAHNT